MDPRNRKTTDRLWHPLRSARSLLVPCLFTAGILVAAIQTAAGDNDSQLFASRQHDFGTVARGSKAVHDFKIKNPYDRPLVIAQVRSSCGCTRPSITQNVIGPGKAGIIKAEYNTRSFLGKKSATITVVITQPIQTEVQLQVTGEIRGDVVLDPGELVIPKIKPGESKSVSTEIHYAGEDTWKIVDVKSSLAFLSAELKELERGNGSVRYLLTVTMQGDFPVGRFQELLSLETSDQDQKKIPLPFSARSESLLTISPQLLEFKQVGLTERSMIQKRIVLRSDQPFRITNVATDDKSLEIKFGNTSRKTQLVTVRFQPTQGISVPRQVPIRFETDLGGQYSRTILARISQ